MAMYFHFDVHNTILFEFWKTETKFGVTISCAIVFLLATMYELFKGLRQHYILQKVNSAHRATETQPLMESDVVQPPNYSKPHVPTKESNSNCPHSKQLKSPANVQHPEMSFRCLAFHTAHLLNTVTYMVQITVSYFLMMIFMCFQTWICIAIIVGFGFGYYITGVATRKMFVQR